MSGYLVVVIVVGGVVAPMQSRPSLERRQYLATGETHLVNNLLGTESVTTSMAMLIVRDRCETDGTRLLSAELAPLAGMERQEEARYGYAGLGRYFIPRELHPVESEEPATVEAIRTTGGVRYHVTGRWFCGLGAWPIAEESLDFWFYCSAALVERLAEAGTARQTVRLAPKMEFVSAEASEAVDVVLEYAGRAAVTGVSVHHFTATFEVEFAPVMARFVEQKLGPQGPLRSSHRVKAIADYYFEPVTGTVVRMAGSIETSLMQWSLPSQIMERDVLCVQAMTFTLLPELVRHIAGIVPRGPSESTPSRKITVASRQVAPHMRKAAASGRRLQSPVSGEGGSGLQRGDGRYRWWWASALFGGGLAVGATALWLLKTRR